MRIDSERRRMFLFASIVLVGICAGCTPLKRESVWRAGDRTVAPLEERVILDRLRERGGQISTFRGLFKTNVSRGTETSSFRQAIVFEKPTSLRIEALPPQGALALYLLVSHRGVVTALTPSEKTASRGASSTGLFRRHLDLPFREGEMMALVSGVVYSEVFGEGELRCGPLECTFQRGDARYVWVFERETGALLEVSIRDPLKLKERLRIRYGDYRMMGEVALPGNIKIELPADGVSIEMVASLLVAQKPIKPEVFEVAIPSDYTIQD